MNSIHPREIDDDHILVDVRTPGEYRSENIPNSVNMPLDDLTDSARSLENHSNIVLVCASGTRAKKACEVLSKENIEAHVLESGMRGWKESGLPTDVGSSKVISIERQVRIVAGAMAATGGVLAILVHPYWAGLSAFVGLGLVFAGVTDTCGMALMLAKLPFNRK
jgi:rhodanese-related sulfurtransferase